MTTSQKPTGGDLLHQLARQYVKDVEQFGPRVAVEFLCEAIGHISHDDRELVIVFAAVRLGVEETVFGPVTP